MIHFQLEICSLHTQCFKNENHNSLGHEQSCKATSSLLRSFQFYLTIEQALICGDPLLVEGVVSPLDPALQPLLEMGHTWNGNGEEGIKERGQSTGSKEQEVGLVGGTALKVPHPSVCPVTLHTHPAIMHSGVTG